MSKQAAQLDSWEASEYVDDRHEASTRMAKKAYSPRFEHRRSHSPLSRHGLHRRGKKRNLH